jgi:polyferredoxin
MKHANPWSIWTRFATLPFLIVAIWSRVWMGWYCVIPIVLLIIWFMVNPTLFRKPKSFENWLVKAVFGEKYWVERKKRPIPKHHNTLVLILILLQMIGVILLGIGLWKLHLY